MQASERQPSCRRSRCRYRDTGSHEAAAADARLNVKAGHAAREPRAPSFATCGADDLGGLNAVVTVAPEALLFLWRGYADPVPRARPAPRFDSARGLVAANDRALPFAKGAHLDRVNREARRRVTSAALRSRERRISCLLDFG